MNEQTSINQILAGIEHYDLYDPFVVDKNVIVLQPNLFEQPKLYQNKEWFLIKAEDIIKV
jgi:hypothetical protein